MQAQSTHIAAGLGRAARYIQWMRVIILLSITLPTGLQATELAGAWKVAKRYFYRRARAQQHNARYYANGALYDYEKIYDAFTMLHKSFEKGTLSFNLHNYQQLYQALSTGKRDDSSLTKKRLQQELIAKTILHTLNEIVAAADSPAHAFTQDVIKVTAHEGHLLDYENLPGIPTRLGSLSEHHPTLTKEACDMLIERTNKGENLLLEVREQSIRRYLETQSYELSSANSPYILKNITAKERVSSCEFRENQNWLTDEIVLRDGRKITFLLAVYQTKYLTFFTDMRISDLLKLHGKADTALQQTQQEALPFPPHTNQEAEAFYLHIRNQLLDIASSYLSAVRALDERLEGCRNSYVKDIFGYDVNMRRLETGFWDSIQDVKVWDQTMEKLMQGNTNIKIGRNHGFVMHKLYMDTLVSTDSLIEDLMDGKWQQFYHTPVQQRYLFDKLQSLLETRDLRVVIETADKHRFYLTNIISSHAFSAYSDMIDPDKQGVMTAEYRTLYGNRMTDIPYDSVSDIILIDRDQKSLQGMSLWKTTSYLIPSALFGIIWYKKRKPKKVSPKKSSKKPVLTTSLPHRLPKQPRNAHTYAKKKEDTPPDCGVKQGKISKIT